MANRYPDADVQFSDSTGAALAGAQLFFYSSGTSTKLNTYSDSSLSIANTNPVVLDANGRAGAIFLQNLKYKVVLAPATDTDPPTSPIWTQDPVYTSDFSAVAQVQGVNGSPNGQLAGTAASAGIPASMAWDFVNNILYVATTTGSSSTTVWTAINASTAAAVVPAPQGRLTLTSQTPVLAADVTAATVVYYTPYTGLVVPIYNGTSMVPTSIVAELSITLQSTHTASNIYDFYIFLVNGVATLGTGPSWSAGTSGSITMGSSVRGTGANGAALTKVQGIWTNTVAMTMTYGSGGSTASVAANQGTYVGTMYVDSTNGQASCLVSFGQSRKWGIWNAYNRVPITMLAGDSTASWTYGTNTIRASNNSSANGMTVLTGLAEENFSIQFIQRSQIAATNGAGNFAGSAVAQTGIGWNVTSAYSGLKAVHQYDMTMGGLGASPVADEAVMNTASYNAAPALGINSATSLEQASVTSATATFFGTNASMQLVGAYRG